MMRHSGEHPRLAVDHLTIVQGGRSRRSRRRGDRAARVSVEPLAAAPPAPRPVVAAVTTSSRGSTDRQVFGAMLRSRRERRGLSLALVADRTKVSAWMFAALEEGDLSKWPHGLYRRSFVRQYLDVVGLPVDDTMAEFERIFGDDVRIQEFAENAAAQAEPAPLAENLFVRMLLAVVAWLTRKLSTA